MKKFILVLLISMLSSIAHAEWLFIGDNADGSTRLLAEKGSLHTEKLDNGVIVLVAKFVYTTNGNLSTPFFAVLVAEDCSRDGGKFITFAEGSSTPSQYYWSKNGPKMYDLMANVMCTVAESTLKQAPPKQDEPKNEFSL